MKKIKKVILVLLTFLIAIPFKVYADSGLDASYDGNGSSDIISSVSSVASPILKIMVIKPTEEDYKVGHIIICVLCLIIFYIITCINFFKLNKKKKKLYIMGISLIPAVIFALICFLTKLLLFIYIVLLIIYIIVVKIITSILLKNRLQKNLEKVKKIDKKFNVDEINEKTFAIYKDIQIAWMNFELDNVKDYLSEKIYTTYQEQLEKLKKDNQKNIMDNIVFKSNEITDIDIVDNIEAIECKMVVTCLDYIVNNEEKVVKGKNNKEREYTYKLVFEKNIKTNKYVLTEKKLLKQK